MPKRPTDELNTELASSTSLKSFLEKNEKYFNSDGFDIILNELLKKSRISKAELAKAAGMSDVYLHQILSGRRNPSRIKILCICIGLKLTLDETQDILKKAGTAMLYARSRREAIIIYGISHGMDLFAINDLLFDADEETLI